MNDVNANPVAYVTGYYAGYTTVKPIDSAVVLPTGMALYSHPADVQELLEALRRLEQVASDCDVGYLDNAVRHARAVLAKWEGK